MIETSNQQAEVKFSVRKGRTYKLAAFESLRLDYAIETSVPPQAVHGSMQNWERQLDGMLNEQAKQLVPKPTDSPKPATSTPTQPAVSSSTDSYAALPWKQSQKNPNLTTIQVTPDLSPEARSLYETLTKAKDQTLYLNNIKYRLSKTEYGEFLQKWSK